MTIEELQAPLPNSCEELEALRSDIIDDKERIQADLGDRNRTNPDGSRMSEYEYWGWRKRALNALNAHNSALRDVNVALKEARRANA